jgi:hypothetical protein
VRLGNVGLVEDSAQATRPAHRQITVRLRIIARIIGSNRKN